MTLRQVYNSPLAISAVLYVLVVWVALVSVPHQELANAPAPLAVVFERPTGASPLTMSVIALVATLNGIIVQIIMSSRVLYGLSQQGDLPAFFGRVNQLTRTPVLATIVTTGAVLLLALAVPLHDLAGLTSRIALIVFALVNLSLIRIKAVAPLAPVGVFLAPSWVPWAGLASCAALVAIDIAFMAARFWS